MNLRDLMWLTKYPKVMPRYSLGAVDNVKYFRFFNKTGNTLESQISSSMGVSLTRPFLIIKEEDQNET